jgi:carbon storage regulator
MLVLRRKAGEAIVLNGVITIHVLAVEGERVKLGISAPPEVVIVRSELLEHQGQSAGPGGGPQSGPGHAQRESYRPYPMPERERDRTPGGDEQEGGANGQGQGQGQGRWGPRSQSRVTRTTPLPIGGNMPR